MKCFCTPRQACPLHHEEYEPEEADREADRREALREIHAAREQENQTGEGEETYRLMKKGIR